MIKALIFVLLFFLLLLIYIFSKNIEKKTITLTYIIIASIVLILTLAFILLDNDGLEKSYISPSFDGKRVIPGYFHEKN
ncbi:MAG: hypothetical protein VX976_01010 [Pseudomonadota bacterium]|nr:hypothetical protein [Pseudomonadota bacterium]